MKQITRWRDAAGKTIKSVVEYAGGHADVGAVLLFTDNTFAALQFDQPELFYRALTIDQALSPEELVAEGIYTEEQVEELHRQREEKKRQEDLAELKTLTHRLDALKQKLGPIETPSATPAGWASRLNVETGSGDA